MFNFYGDKTNPDRGFFYFRITSPTDPDRIPKVGEQWCLSSVIQGPFGTDLEDFEYVADTTPFTVKF